MEYSEKLHNIIANLQSFKESHTIKTEPETLQAPIDYTLSNSGKKIRPIICYLVHTMFADPSDDMYYASWAIEYFHNFTLMHDDIMDQAETRRGEPSNYLKYGTDQTILSGDAMNILAYMYLQKISRDLLPDVLYSFNRTALQVCEGQQYDMDFEKQDRVTYDEYLKMISMKTAALFALSAELGASTTPISADTVNEMYQFGENLGIAFQLWDDYLDVFGNESGKTLGGDILMRKKTCLYIKSTDMLEGDERKDFINQYQNADTNTVPNIIETMQKLGVDDVIKNEIKIYTDRALDILNGIDTLSGSKDELIQLCDQLTSRNY